MPIEKTTFLIYSLEPWGDMWYSKHHYAAYLAKDHIVYFIDLPDRWRWRDLFSFGLKVRKVPEGVHVVEYRNNLPLNILPSWLQGLIAVLNARKLKRLTRKGPVVHWCFFPSTILNNKVLRRNAKVIYHVVDPYQNLPNDTHFAINADLIVAINPWYLKYYSELNARCILVPHGVRREDREFDPEIVESCRAAWGDYAILATGLNKFVNYDLLRKVAERYPELDLVIVGPLFPMRPAAEKARERLFRMPNVSYAGVKHPEELKHLVRGARLGLLTYDFETTRSVPISAGRTPLKVLTYLAQLCPVVSTNNSYVPVLDHKGYFKAEDPEHFVNLVGRVLRREIAVDQDVVSDYMDSVEYGLLIERIIGALNDPAILSESGSAITVRANGLRRKVPYHSPILIISNEAWNGPRYSKHRYSIALTAYREVFFLDPSPQWEPMHLLRSAVRSHSTPEGVTILSYFNVVPLFGGILGGLNDMIVSRRIRAYFERIGKKDLIVWTFDPSRLSSPKNLDACISIYHCADDHSFRMRGEHLLAKRCDHVFCIARGLMQRFKPFNASVHHVPHGLSEQDMLPAVVDRSAAPFGGSYGLYIGNINDRHDFELWRKLIHHDMDQKWVVVGPMNVTDAVGVDLLTDPPPNLLYLGPVPYNELRELIAASSFGFLYMKRDDPANRFSSQKIVQFMALGKPFFCSWFTEYEDKQDLIYMSDDNDTALAQMDEWRKNGETDDRSERRIRYAETLLFDRLIAQLPIELTERTPRSEPS